MTTLIIAILIVLIASALCSGSEAALFSVSMVRVKQLAEGESKSAKALLRIKEKMDAPIASIVIMNNIANIVGSMTIGAIAATVLDNSLLGWFSGGLTFMVILCSEIIPKTLGEMYSEKISLFISRPILMLSTLLYPIIWMLNIITLPLTRHAQKFTTDESEITFLTKMGEQTGVIEEDESQMIQKVFKLNDITAYDIMTPRVNMSVIDISKFEDDQSELLKSITSLEHTRIVVINERYDNVVGVVSKLDMFNELMHIRVDKLVKPMHSFIHTAKADEMLKHFQESKQHLAIVKDEFGGVAGVVSLEDVIEIITGEIMDENDTTEDLRKVNYVTSD